jgi:hypothetical protein
LLAVAAAERIQELLKSRNKQRCEMKTFASWMGNARMKSACSQTGLPYAMCCGRKSPKIPKKQKGALLSAL